MLVWFGISGTEVAGCAAGYSGGGAFQLEKFYLTHNGTVINLLQIDNEDKVHAKFGVFSEVVPPYAVEICENCQDEIISWHDEEIWEEAENLYLRVEKVQELDVAGDMMFLADANIGVLSEVLESIGITSGPSKRN